MTPLDIVTQTVKILDAKKARDIRVLEISKLTSLGDYFVIASGGSTTQVKALAGEVAFQLKQQGLEARQVEQGEKTNQWVLIDFSDVIVHIFLEETRHFYDLERLWADAPELDVDKLITEAKKEGKDD